MASPRCAAGTHWLTITRTRASGARWFGARLPGLGARVAGFAGISGPGSFGKRLVRGRAVDPQLLERLGLRDLIPEVEGDRRRPGAGH